MAISIQQIMTKIEEELKSAKASSSEEKIRERIYSIKTLCELVLEEQPSQANHFQEAKRMPVTPLHSPLPTSVQSLSTSQPKKMEMDDEANGDSLLDF